MGSVTGGKQGSKSSSKVRIPAFLRPLITQGANVAGGALNNLSGQINGGDLVAGFSEQELLAQLLGTERALGEGDFFSTAQNTIRDAAGGVSLDEFLDPTALATLRGAQGGGLDFLPASVRERLDGTTGPLAGTDALSSLTESILPTSVTDFLTRSGETPGVDTLTGLLEGGINDTTRSALESAAAGDFLFGGQGFDQAVDAAVRSATPAILSTFGRAGAGAGTGALAQAQVGESAIDAFAQQFARERGLQLDAANQLAALERSDRNDTASIASRLADIGITGRGQDIDAAGVLGNLSLSDANRRGNVATTIAGLDLDRNAQDINSASVLGGFAEGAQNRGTGAAQLLAELGFGERGNALASAELLPSIATSDLAVLESIGASRRGLEQDQIDAPIERNLQLLMAALSGTPISDLLGRKTSGSSRAFGFSS